MTETFKVEFKNLVSLVARLHNAMSEQNINQISNLISFNYKNLLDKTGKDTEEYTQLLKLRKIIIKEHDAKQELIDKYHKKLKDINKDNFTYHPETNQLFHDFFTASTQTNSTSIKKKYTLEEITTQIDQIFDSEAFLTASGTINQTTQKILLERIYEASKGISINPEVIELLVNRVVSGKKEKIVIPTKDGKSQIVKGIEITPSLSGVCYEDEKRLTDGIDQLSQS